jgi:2-C-methyl-D-erythritol 4-phosphate cytidylyltransferase
MIIPSSCSISREREDKVSSTFSCIITAAGLGTRFSKNRRKQFVRIKGTPIIELAIDIFYTVNEINEIIITLPEKDYDFMSRYLSDQFMRKLKYVVGGDTRQKSVYNALKHCDKANKYVIIHDGVRPYFKREYLNEMMSIIGQSINREHRDLDCFVSKARSKLAMTDTEVKALVPGAKPVNTIKSINEDNIIETIDRDTLIEVSTPQIFDLKLIKKYHEKARKIDHTFTDDASILEYFNIPVKWYKLDSLNIKITTREDLKLVRSVESGEWRVE